MSDFARQVTDIAQGRQPPMLRVGDIDVTRDFTDVRDVVEAYFALLERGHAGEIYNVCSGVEHSLSSILKALMDLAGVDAQIQTQSERMRPSEQRRMRGDASKILAATGWKVSTPLSVSLRAALQSWHRGKDE